MKELIMQIRRFMSLLLILVPLAALTGCMKKKKKTDDKKGVMHAGKGIPLAGSSKSGKMTDKDLAEFLLEEDEHGCPKKMSMSIDTHTDEHKVISWKNDENQTKQFQPIYFDFDRFNIREDQMTVAAADVKLVKEVVADGNKAVNVGGHSDHQCVNQAYNTAISQKRAHTVANVLADAGVPRELIKPVGYGDSRPAVDLPGKVQENRRVEIVTLVS